MRPFWKRKKEEPECPREHEHVRTKSGFFLSIDLESSTGSQLKRVLEDEDATEDQVNRAVRRYMFGEPQ